MKKWITKNGIRIFQILEGRSNSFLISGNNKYILIDTGIRNSWKKLNRNLHDFNIDKKSFLALILTHVHFDHCENAKKIKDHYKAKIIVHESEAELLLNGMNALTGGAFPITNHFFNLINGKKLITKIKFEPSNYDITVKEKYDLKEYGLNCYIIHTPGHSTGSISIIIDNEIAIVGDTMFGVFKNSVYPPWALDTKEMIKSWKKLLDTGCEIFLPGHGTNKSREILQNQYTKYEYKII